MDFIDHRSTANFIFSLSATDEKFRITNNGDVGIGTSSPSTKLEVNGVITTAGLTTTANINFGDNDKAVFGAGSDLQIFHDGSNSYVKDTGTGDLMLQGVNVRIQGATTGNNMFVGVDNGASTLYYQNNAKLATTSTGIDVTGTAEADTLETSTASGGLINIVRDDPTIGTNNSLGAIYWNSTEDSGTTVNQGAAILALADQNHSTIASGSRLSLQTTAVSATTPTERLRISAGGDISFYEDTGTTAKLFWDASAEALGIGTSAPGSLLELEATGSTVFDGTATDGQAADGTTLAIQNLSDTDNTFSQILFRNRNTSKAVSRIASLTDSTGTEMAFVVENNGSPAEILRLEKTGNVGIGTSSPTGPLHVAGSGSTVPIKIDNTGTGGDTWRIWSTNDAASDGGGKLGFYNEDTATRAMTLDSSGNVGIGTVSPTTLLEIKDTTATAGLCITADNASNSDLNLGDEDDVNIQRIRSDHTSNSLQFQTNNGERMRIDASGNLLVGTTSTNPAGGTGVGIQLNPIGQVNTSRSGGASGVFNRTTSDGEIIQLKKDGTTVGSIGTSSSSLYIGKSSGSGLMFQGGNTIPVTGSSAADATYDLGASGVRFKDLYLSGTAYTNALGVGTTSPAAKVDIVDTAADVQLRVYKFDGTNNTRLTLTADDSGAKIHYRDATNGGALRFNNNAGEMARFDASSNLLVGKTSDNNAVAGTTISNSGIVKVTRTDWSLLLNRLSTDGSLALFQKDGTTVGSIGTSGGSAYIGGYQNAGLYFNGTSDVRPWNTSTQANLDNSVDLGNSSSRFKDLHLSGTAKLTSGNRSTDGKGGALIVGGNSDSNGLTTNTRKIGLITCPSYDNTDGNMALITGDTSSASANYIYIGSAYTGYSSPTDIVFRTGSVGTIGSEAARFDASGNLLVGQSTSTAPASDDTVGVAISPLGYISTHRTGVSAEFGRNNSDGDIAVFRRDGTSVGSIGTAVGNAYYAGTATGITFGSANLYPTNASGTKTNGALDIGSSSNRFKDLYLSGGVYLGGTGSANKLDDYEEGTWTPTIQGSTTTGVGVYSAQNGTYTKVGRLVTVQANISVTSWTTDPVGNLRLAGLPFSGKSGAVNTGSLMSSNFNYSVGGSDAITASVYMAGGTNNLRVYVTRDNATWLQQPVTGEAMEFIYSISYIVA